MPDAPASFLSGPTADRRPRQLTYGMSCDERGLCIGAGTRLVRMTEPGRLAVKADGARCIALLSVLCRRDLGPEVLRPIEAAAAYWAAGDKALANLRLVFAGLPKLESPADAHRLDTAAWCLDQGLAPRDLMKALDLDPSVLELRMYDPNQPRVPAGVGRDSGRWTDQTDGARSDGLYGASTVPRPVRVAANGPFTPNGVEATPSGSVDPLDPANLNKLPPSPQEQQAIVDTLNIIANGTTNELKKLQPHSYRNLPHFMTGAVLPLDPQGYKSFDVRSDASVGRGLGRLVISNSDGRAYYTSNHYLSFYAIDLSKRFEGSV